MVRFEIKQNPEHPGEFSYDLRALAQSFFPELLCEIIEREDWSKDKGYPITCFVEEKKILEVNLSEGYTKNEVKITVYDAFVKEISSDKTLGRTNYRALRRR